MPLPGRHCLDFAHAVFPASTVSTVPVMFFARSLEQEFDRIGHVVDLNQALERAAAHDLLPLLVLESLRHFGIDKSGSDRIHVHSHASHFPGQRPGEADQGALVAL